ncbi:MAG: YrhK family protein [Solirubrobacterales bacterium]
MSIPEQSIKSPGRFTWRVATLFMIGSFCFALGTVVAVSSAPTASGAIYFIGSIFFTTAGYGQFLSALNHPSAERPRWFGRVEQSVDWKASAIQSFGTVCFNISTGFALVTALTTSQVNRLVWSPDVFGSIAFLWSSWLAFAAVRASWHGHPRRGATWATAALNLLGSIFFGISAVGAYLVPETETLYNTAWANGGTFLGAVCFFFGAWLMWPEARKLELQEERA